MTHASRTQRANAIIKVLEGGPMPAIDIRTSADVPMTPGQFATTIRYLENLGRVTKCGRMDDRVGNIRWKLVA